MILPVTIIFIWVLIGYLFWRAVYYGALKYWYIQYKLDSSNWPAGVQWRKIMPAVAATGPLNLIIISTLKSLKRITFAHGITLYFKMPADAEKINVE